MLGIAGLAAVWTAIAFWSPGPLDTDPVWVRRILALMGGWFLVCGLWTYARRPGAASGLLCAYCALACIHWGGVIGSGDQAADRVLLFAFVTLGVALAEGTFLHLAISFPSVALHRAIAVGVYLPAVVAAAITVASLATPIKLSLVFPLITVGSIYGIVGGVIWLVRLGRNTIGGLSTRARIGVSAALIIGWLPHLAGGFGVPDLGEASGLSNLSLALIPAALAWLMLTRLPDTA